MQLRARKELQRLKRIILKRDGMIRAMKKQLNSDSDVKCTTVQFHNNSYNSQSNHWIGMKFYVKSPERLSYLELKFQVK